MKSRLQTTSVVALALACCTLGAQEADRTRADALARRAADRLRALHEEADQLAAQARTLLGDLRQLEIEREIRNEELRQVERDTAAIMSDLSALDAQVTAIEQQARADAPQLRSRLVSLYKLGRGRYARLLLSTSDVRQLGQASRMVAALAAQDHQRVERYRRRLDELARAREGLQDRRRRMAALGAEAAQARIATDRAVAARNTLIKEIDGRRDLNARLAGELDSARQKLQATLANLSAGAASAARASLPIGPFRGDLNWPVAGTVRQPFGLTPNGRTAATSGIDIAAPEGAPVYAVHDGTIVHADTFAGFGRLLILDHGDQAFSLYGNLGDIAGPRGQAVQRGDIVGSVGIAATGAAGLYFELRIDGRPVDPLQWFRKR